MSKINDIMNYPTVRLVVLALLSVILYSCHVEDSKPKEVIRIKGSDTMLNLSLRWAENFMQYNKEVSIQVSGGGSETGIAALFNGSIKIANISRKLTDGEIQNARQLGIEPIGHIVAEDAISLVVNSTNKIDSLTVYEIKKIFTGQVDNWKLVGGDDQKIILYGREKSSGTYEIFRDIILNDGADSTSNDFFTGMKVLQGTAAIAEAVSKDKYSIGFGGIGYFASRKELKVLRVKNNKDAKAISPLKYTVSHIQLLHQNNYPLSRKLYCYTNGKPEGEVKKFIEYIISSQGQKVVRQMEFIPLTFIGQ